MNVLLHYYNVLIYSFISCTSNVLLLTLHRVFQVLHTHTAGASRRGGEAASARCERGTGPVVHISLCVCVRMMYVCVCVCDL